MKSVTASLLTPTTVAGVRRSSASVILCLFVCLHPVKCRPNTLKPAVLVHQTALQQSFAQNILGRKPRTLMCFGIVGLFMNIRLLCNAFAHGKDNRLGHR